MSLPKTIGLLTIGQSPRPDIADEVRQMLPADCGIVECGALDGASPALLQSVAPQGQAPFYVTQLRDGQKVKIARSAAQELLQQKINLLEKQGVDAAALFCTGEFSPFSAGIPVLESSVILKQAAAAAYRDIPVGIVVPDAAQIPALSARWTEQGIRHVIRSCSPYGETDESLQVCRGFAAQPLDFIILDCIGFSKAFAEQFGEKTGKRILLPRQVVCAYLTKTILV